jgi:hypothetical protein
MGSVLLFSQDLVSILYTLVYCSKPSVAYSQYRRVYIFFLVMTVMATCSVADPEPNGSAFILVRWIWIQIRIGNTDPDSDPGGPK